jgi:hypothetical protein
MEQTAGRKNRETAWIGASMFNRRQPCSRNQEYLIPVALGKDTKTAKGILAAGMYGSAFYSSRPELVCWRNNRSSVANTGYEQANVLNPQSPFLPRDEKKHRGFVIISCVGRSW